MSDAKDTGRAMQQDTVETPLEDILNREAPPEEPMPEVQEQPPEPVETPAQEPAAPEPKSEQTMVPLAALHKERDAIRDLRAELEAMKAPPQQAQEPQQAPDPVMDPEAFNQYQRAEQQRLAQTMQGQIYSQKLGMSRFQFEQEHGQDAANDLVEWFGQQPQHVQQQAQEHPHPFAFAQKLKQDAELSERMSDPKTREAFEAFLANQNNMSPAPAAPATTANARNVGDRGGPQWAGPTPLEQILPNP